MTKASYSSPPSSGRTKIHKRPVTLLPSPNHSTNSHFSISCLALTKSPTRQLARSDTRATYDAFNRQFIPPPSGSLLMLPDNSPNHSQLIVAARAEALAAPRCHLSMKSRTKSEPILDTTSQSDAKERSEWVLLAVFATWRRNSHKSPNSQKPSTHSALSPHQITPMRCKGRGTEEITRESLRSR